MFLTSLVHFSLSAAIMGSEFFLLSIFSLFSGVALDRQWRATVLQEKEPTQFIILVVADFIVSLGLITMAVIIYIY